MDVITTALTAAIADGSASAAYQMLKSRLTGKSPRVDEAIADLEQDPGSLSRQFAVSDALASAGLAGDRYLRAAARNLVDEVERRRAVQASSRPAGQPNHAVLQVFFASDRLPTGDRHPARQFGAGRGEPAYGSCEVSVPHRGAGDEPALPTLLRLQARPDAENHAVLLRCEVAQREPYFAALAAALASAAGRGALLFVHGYRTSFEDAARRTAYIVHALRFAGIPLFYSWPSQGRLSGYVVDETNVEWAQPRLAAFLAEFLAQTDAAHLILLGHGMGGRALAGAAAAVFAARPDLAPRLRHIILVAPDIDADILRRDIAPQLAAVQGRVTLYASSNDAALRDAQAASPHPRAGDSASGLLVLPGVQTIDASAVDTELTDVPRAPGVRSVLADIGHLIAGSQHPAERPGLRAVDAAAGRYWTIHE